MFDVQFVGAKVRRFSGTHNPLFAAFHIPYVRYYIPKPPPKEASPKSLKASLHRVGGLSPSGGGASAAAYFG